MKFVISYQEKTTGLAGLFIVTANKYSTAKKQFVKHCTDNNISVSEGSLIAVTVNS